jgi:hypothetical protein
MQTPAKNTFTYSKTPGTTIASTPSTAIAPNAPMELLDRGTNLGKRNLDDEFEVVDNTKESLEKRLTHVKGELAKIQNKVDERNQLYDDRVKEIGILKLPAKLLKKSGGRKSNKRNKKHRKKTSKRRSRK